MKQEHKMEKELVYLKKLAEESLSKRDWALFFQASSTYCALQYTINQIYIDDDIERMILEAAKNIPYCCTANKTTCYRDRKTVLFYDGFGSDLRGLVLIYIQALVELGYQVVFVTSEKAKGKQPNIQKLTQDSDMIWEYFSPLNYNMHYRELVDYFDIYCPDAAFFYTTPDDIPAAVAFAQNEGKSKRYLINLTDHAFWSGSSAVDYCIEFRDYGAYISHAYRHIPKEKLLMLPYYPWYDKNVKFTGFPFDTTGKKVVFSGGALYKTMDDSSLYYVTVEQILRKNDDTIFLYAGFGDSSKLELLQSKFPDRIFFVPERGDLYQLMEHVDIYLNTYPMVGGLMTQYAALAGKTPYMLKHGSDDSGILFDQEQRGMEYWTSESLVEDVTRVLKDEQYRREKEKLLVGAVLTPECFAEQVRRLIETESTDICIHYTPVDTTAFRKTYLERLNAERVLVNAIARFVNYRLLYKRPRYFVKKIMWKISHR